MTSKIACMAARARAFPLDHGTRDLATTLKYEFDATDHEVGAALEMAAEQMRDEIERARRELRRHRTG